MISPTLPAPVRTRLRRVVRAIAETEVADELDRNELEGIPYLAETAEVLERRLLGMPKHFAAGMVALTLLFDRSTLASHGGVFSRLSLAQRREVMGLARARLFGPLKNFTTFYDKMGPFIFWSQLEEHHALHLVLGEVEA